LFVLFIYGLYCDAVPSDYFVLNAEYKEWV